MGSVFVPSTIIYNCIYNVIYKVHPIKFLNVYNEIIEANIKRIVPCEAYRVNCVHSAICDRKLLSLNDNHRRCLKVRSSWGEIGYRISSKESENSFTFVEENVNWNKTSFKNVKVCRSKGSLQNFALSNLKFGIVAKIYSNSKYGLILGDYAGLSECNRNACLQYANCPKELVVMDINNARRCLCPYFFGPTEFNPIFTKIPYVAVINVNNVFFSKQSIELSNKVTLIKEIVI